MASLHSAGRFVLSCLLLSGQAFSYPVVQIDSHVHALKGQPSWLILLRDPENGATIPWLHDFTRPDSAWTVIPPSHDYQIIASVLTFGTNQTVINNFCGIEDGILSGKSLQISLSGQFAPPANALRCHVIQYSSQ